jgi:hypothetical protein
VWGAETTQSSCVLFANAHTTAPRSLATRLERRKTGFLSFCVWVARMWLIAHARASLAKSAQKQNSFIHGQI